LEEPSTLNLTNTGPLEEAPEGQGPFDPTAGALDDEEDWVRVIATFEVSHSSRAHHTESVHEVVLQKSIPAQIRRLILFSNDEG
jgi:hypothetical protein